MKKKEKGLLFSFLFASGYFFLKSGTYKLSCYPGASLSSIL